MGSKHSLVYHLSMALFMSFKSIFRNQKVLLWQISFHSSLKVIATCNYNLQLITRKNSKMFFVGMPSSMNEIDIAPF
jgi:hypothetical protein